MKLVSWNVNGIRAASKKGMLDWLEQERPDVFCLQETKAQPEQLTSELLEPLDYQSYWHSAEKKGYSGVATYSRIAPKSVSQGIGDQDIDREGRVQTLVFEDFTLVNAYFPNSQREGARLGYKLHFCEAILTYCRELVQAGSHIVLCGDYNIAHEEIDLKNPKTNKKNAGFLPEERAWMTRFLEAGFSDVFRERHPEEEGHYTWWSYRPGVRERNVGWRIDYHCVDEGFRKKIKNIGHWPAVYGSDHCPIYLEI